MIIIYLELVLCATSSPHRQFCCYRCWCWLQSRFIRPLNEVIKQCHKNIIWGCCKWFLFSRSFFFCFFFFSLAVVYCVLVKRGWLNGFVHKRALWLYYVWRVCVYARIHYHFHSESSQSASFLLIFFSVQVVRDAVAFCSTQCWLCLCVVKCVCMHVSKHTPVHELQMTLNTLLVRLLLPLLLLLPTPPLCFHSKRMNMILQRDYFNELW